MEKTKLNTSGIYILSIVGFFCCCVAGIGVVPAGIAYVMANNKHKEVLEDPEAYENGPAMSTARIIALISLTLNIMYLLYTVYTIYTVGWDELLEQSRQRMQEMGFEQ